MKNTTWRTWLIFTIFCAILYFPLFHHLTWEPIHNWDESLFAMRAGYMAEEGKYLPDYSHWVEGGPLHRSTKPPFTTWIQALFIKILGHGELSLRLPVALAALATVALFVFIGRKHLNCTGAGICAGFVLVTSAGFIRDHAARTGDQDVPLAFYMLAGAYAFYRYLEAEDLRQRRVWLSLLTVSLIASALTKYVFGLFFLPAFFFYAIYKKQLGRVLARGSTWVAALVFLAAVFGWLAIMEWRLPGFFERAIFYEMFDRYTTVIEHHKAPWGYFFVNFWEGWFMPWLLLLPIPVAMILLKEYRPVRDVLVLMALCAASLLLIVSFSQTKTTHYEVVAYPPLALLAGVGLYRIWAALLQLWRAKKHLPVAILAAAFCTWTFLILPYWKIINTTYMPLLTNDQEEYGYLFRRLEKRPDLQKFTLIHTGFDGQAIYYAGLFNRKKGFDIQLISHTDQVQVGQTVMACDGKIIKALFEQFELQGLETYEQCFVAQVKAKKVGMRSEE
ncbi:MAG: glycosyltransferase family 39 protein [Bacteroidota bacterium]